MSLYGQSLRLPKLVAVVEVDEQRLVVINPEIILKEGSVRGEEGCLSIPDYYEEVSRPAKVRVSFLDREMMKTLERERALKQSGQVTASSDPNVVEFRGADYFLTGKLEGMSTRTSQGTSDYVLYSFRLTDARTSEIVWEDSAEVKIQGLEDAAYR